MPSICFLTAQPGAAAPPEQRNDNPQRLPAAFMAADWEVYLADHQALCLAAGQVVLNRLALADEPDRPLPQAPIPLHSFDLIWILGFGNRDSFIDRTQLLTSLDAGRFVNDPAALLHLHAKYHLPLSDLAKHHPESYASCDAEWLLQIIRQGGEWVLKPPATSFGRSVFRARRDDPNLRVIIEQLTGHDGSRYCLLQRFVAEIERGEKRVLIANGMPLGAYLRRADDDYRVNLSGPGQASPTELSAEERALAERAGASLASSGVRFAAVDIAYPWLIECNLVNPGGLSTIERLTGEDLAPRAAARLAPLAHR